MVADQVGHLAHLNARDTTLAFVSRAPQPDIERWKARMGWEQIPWYTLTDDFDADFGVDEWHGTNAFFRDGDRIFRTYFVNKRGDEALGSTWSYLDITALGRQEEWEDSPEGYPQTPPYAWWNLHDEYDAADRLRGGPLGRPPPRSAARGARARDRARRRRAAGGDPAVGHRRWRQPAAGARLADAAPATPTGARDLTDNKTRRKAPACPGLDRPFRSRRRPRLNGHEPEDAACNATT